MRGGAAGVEAGGARFFGGAVGGDRRHEAALHQVDEHRPDASLDDVRAECPDDARVARRGVSHGVRHRHQIARTETIRQTRKKLRQAGTWTNRTTEVRDGHLARSRLQRVGLDA